MAYLLSRAVIFLIGWAATCGIAMNVFNNVDPVFYYAAAATWGLAGIAYLAYLHKLRRAADLQRNSSFSPGRSRS